MENLYASKSRAAASTSNDAVPALALVAPLVELAPPAVAVPLPEVELAAPCSKTRIYFISKYALSKFDGFCTKSRQVPGQVCAKTFG